MKRIFTVMKKELVRFFTDKRMLASLFLPGILIFVMYSLIGNFMPDIISVSVIDKTYENKIVLTNNYNTTENTNKSLLAETVTTYFTKQGYVAPSITYINTTDVDNYMTKLTDKSIDTLIVFDNNFEYLIKNPSGTNKPNIKVYYNSENKNSETTFSIITTAIDTLYTNFTVNAGVDKPNVGTQSSTANTLFSFLFPMITIMLLYSTTITICPESIAGEKERGTIASVLITPIKRSELAIGKVLALSIVSVAGSIVSALGVILSLPMLVSGSGFGFTIDFGSAILLVFLIISAVILFVTVSSLASTFAKTIKEASAYLGPTVGIIILAAVAPMLINSTSLFTSLIPIYNTCQCMGSILTSTFNPLYFGLSILMNLIYSGIIIFFIVRLFNNEKIMFNN